jgi:hypothetical protein
VDTPIPGLAPSPAPVPAVARAVVAADSDAERLDRLDRLEHDLALVDQAMAQVDAGDLDGFDLTVAPLLASGPEAV